MRLRVQPQPAWVLACRLQHGRLQHRLALRSLLVIIEYCVGVGFLDNTPPPLCRCAVSVPISIAFLKESPTIPSPQIYCFWSLAIKADVDKFILTVLEEGEPTTFKARSVPLSDAKLYYLGVNPKERDEVG